MKITVSHNLDEIKSKIADIGKQARYAAAVALTKTGQDVRDELKSEMARKFDKPTPYTLNSLFLRRATRDNLEAQVWVKDNTFGSGTPADRYLGPEIYGGARTQKGMERALQAAGLMRSGDYAIPAAGAQLDAFGNVKRSQIVQILSQLRVQMASGFESRRSNSAASRRTVARQGVTYFALPTQVRGLKPGIYLKKRFSRGSAIRPVFIFTSQAGYAKRFDFFGVASRVAEQRLPIHFERELEKAMRTAMPTQQQGLF
ncbi:hypothetical protein [Noviherbaspirillum denitrificans]|uniref:Uncharacterized protein n=1 Tax=Noviherbaspirillum denitrificans TaxID=1968433 RepID=A0A254T6Z7_9BURK|nr:hypothetical protein [Noviherbaspirillum denitrificans]OWW18421.1 hypothetical protein AYR66_01060 [Noviherbaspirillum denitrificans]OWW19385.1 hypothetical protein AYR66_07545 [Noviherbaspirillum denitrificans]